MVFLYHLFHDFFAGGAVAHFHDVDAFGWLWKQSAMNVVAGNFNGIIIHFYSFYSTNAYCYYN